jgi:hypothetical protein
MKQLRGRSKKFASEFLFNHAYFPITSPSLFCPRRFQCFYSILRGDQIGLFKLVTLNCILNRITGVTFGC